MLNVRKRTTIRDYCLVALTTRRDINRTRWEIFKTNATETPPATLIASRVKMNPRWNGTANEIFLLRPVDSSPRELMQRWSDVSSSKFKITDADGLMWNSITKGLRALDSIRFFRPFVHEIRQRFSSRIERSINPPTYVTRVPTVIEQLIFPSPFFSTGEICSVLEPFVSLNKRYEN